MKKTFQVICGLLVTFLAVYFFLKNVDLGQVGPALKRVDAFTVCMAFLLTLFSLYIRGVRWGFLLPDDPAADRRGLFPLCSIGFMVNQILPARIGEAARIYLLYKRNRFSVHASIGSVLAERIVDAFFYALFILAPYYAYHEFLAGRRILGGFQLDTLAQFCLVVAGGFVLVIVFIIVMRGRIDGMEKALVVKFPFLAGGISHAFRLYREATAWLHLARKWGPALLLSPFTVGSFAVLLWLIARSVGLAVTPLQALLTAGFLALGAAVPSSPGYIGTLHVACMEALVLFGHDRNSAAAVAILYHLLTTVATVGIGLFFFFRLNLNFREIRKIDALKTDS